MNSITYSVFITFCALLPFHSTAQSDCEVPNSDISQSAANNTKRKVGQLKIVTNPIFDESEKDTMAIHYFANWLHVNTQQAVVEERLPFQAGDTIDHDDLLEAERIIRNQPYIRDAKVSFSPQCNFDDPTDVEVTTWDNWSLIPTVSFGRKGGENKFSLGIKEDNVLGTGIRARVRYSSDVQRSGYQFTLKSPMPFAPHSTIFVDLMDNDDGQLSHLVFDKPFYDLHAKNMFFGSYLHDDKTQDIYQAGQTRNRFDLQNHRYEAAMGWQLNEYANRTTRLKMGVVEDQSKFLATDLDAINDSLLLPQDRHYQYPWIGIEYLQRDYKVMSEIYLIKQAEDINLGWHFESKLGVELNDLAPGASLGYHLEVNASKGFNINDGLLLLALSANSDFNTSQPDRLITSAKAEYFYRYSDLLGFYSRLSGTASKNQYLDDPVTLGDENGVRGYPLQYQHGDNSVSGSIEARLYTDYNIYKILDVGFATFVDVGKAWSGSQTDFNETNSTLASMGLGARLYSNRSSHKSVIHMDIVKPFSTSINVDSWEWRLQIKQSF
ncbi:ShlB/FhaC/HecB family hemolysin secretion/activation protein [Aliiglaciecola sp. LCG003]|uniref:ShlB/FhaC/HecB family hemolysin secretion/activation protein n=1 Tax=Aliiglaciecola sp. LCG003 TaxID=3053655 RepID=UPI00257483B5|nr:ShlB/FhaC/HecB family hemolysin secretion/activation protein [Aliiglaciecola sp. LCG003]WJG09903.1 ShlB/FhaC/HecB family hemolysin secretion/activation protein [Aliiglaciecola sp. LCG003]